MEKELIARDLGFNISQVYQLLVLFPITFSVSLLGKY